MVNFQGFFPCLIYPRLGTEEGSNLKMLKGIDRNPPPQSLLSLAKGIEKGQHSNIENFHTIIAMLQSNITEKNYGTMAFLLAK